MIEGSRQVGGESGTVWGRPERGSIDRGGRDFEEKNYRFRLSTVDMRDLARLQWWTRFKKRRDSMKLLILYIMGLSGNPSEEVLSYSYTHSIKISQRTGHGDQ